MARGPGEDASAGGDGVQMVQFPSSQWQTNRKSGHRYSLAVSMRCREQVHTWHISEQAGRLIEKHYPGAHRQKPTLMREDDPLVQRAAQGIGADRAVTVFLCLALVILTPIWGWADAEPGYVEFHFQGTESDASTQPMVRRLAEAGACP